MHSSGAVFILASVTCGGLLFILRLHRQRTLLDGEGFRLVLPKAISVRFLLFSGDEEEAFVAESRERLVLGPIPLFFGAVVAGGSDLLAAASGNPWRGCFVFPASGEGSLVQLLSGGGSAGGDSESAASAAGPLALCGLGLLFLALSLLQRLRQTFSGAAWELLISTGLCGLTVLPLFLRPIRRGEDFSASARLALICLALIYSAAYVPLRTRIAWVVPFVAVAAQAVIALVLSTGDKKDELAILEDDADVLGGHGSAMGPAHEPWVDLAVLALAGMLTFSSRRRLELFERYAFNTGQKASSLERFLSEQYVSPVGGAAVGPSSSRQGRTSANQQGDRAASGGASSEAGAPASSAEITFNISANSNDDGEAVVGDKRRSEGAAAAGAPQQRATKGGEATKEKGREVETSSVGGGEEVKKKAKEGKRSGKSGGVNNNNNNSNHSSETSAPQQRDAAAGEDEGGPPSPMMSITSSSLASSSDGGNSSPEGCERRDISQRRIRNLRKALMSALPPLPKISPSPNQDGSPAAAGSSSFAPLRCPWKDMPLKTLRKMIEGIAGGLVTKDPAAPECCHWHRSLYCLACGCVELLRRGQSHCNILGGAAGLAFQKGGRQGGWWQCGQCHAVNTVATISCQFCVEEFGAIYCSSWEVPDYYYLEQSDSERYTANSSGGEESEAAKHGEDNNMMVQVLPEQHGCLICKEQWQTSYEETRRLIFRPRRTKREKKTVTPPAPDPDDSSSGPQTDTEVLPSASLIGKSQDVAPTAQREGNRKKTRPSACSSSRTLAMTKRSL